MMSLKKGDVIQFRPNMEDSFFAGCLAVVDEIFETKEHKNVSTGETAFIAEKKGSLLVSGRKFDGMASVFAPADKRGDAAKVFPTMFKSEDVELCGRAVWVSKSGEGSIDG